MSWSDDYTTVTVRNETHSALESLKPFETMSFDELIQDMVEEYDNE